jgi:hypothetical protein
MKFNIDTKIDINFTEDQIKDILRETITVEMPNITVEDITFVIKRNPTTISAAVDASMVGFESTTMKATVAADTEEQLQLPEVSNEPVSVTDFLDLD